MKRIVIVVAVLFGLFALFPAWIWSPRLSPTPGAIYTVAQVQVGIAGAPQMWIGRIIRVRGIEIGASDYTGRQWATLAPATEASGPLNDADVIVIAPEPPTAVMALARRIPFLSDAIPPPQRPHNGRVAVYQLRLQDPTRCTTILQALPCPVGVVVDAQSNGW